MLSRIRHSPLSMEYRQENQEREFPNHRVLNCSLSDDVDGNVLFDSLVNNKQERVKCTALSF